ncbi:MAG: nuclear transport factor 2 family protein [Ignavibacteria bacterium]|nr:nuclear transport factor 2 family protein [Ignavibacteria bacterium]
MKHFLIAVIFIYLTGFSFAQNIKNADRDAILKVLEDQRIAWNSGDIEGYMQGYWKSDSLRFVGKSGVRYGWSETLSSYKKGYPTKAEMGSLTFNVISLEQLSETSLFMIGKWSLTRVENSVSGHFMLIWKKVDGKWLITADHSS